MGSWTANIEGDMMNAPKLLTPQQYRECPYTAHSFKSIVVRGLGALFTIAKSSTSSYMAKP